MTSTGTCPKCGTLLFSESAAGLCPKCLGAVGFAGVVQAGDAVLSSAPKFQRLGDYELIEEIARGGMGVVYKARQVSLDRIVAVKVVLHGPFSSEEFVKRFQTEAAAVAGLQHPNIVGIYEVGQSGGDHFFSMEYIEGRNLAETVRDKPLSPRRAAGYLKTIAEAVHYAHQRGVLHRDLKPSNVLVDVFDQPRITDFGLAKLLDSDAELTTTGQVLGSPSFISPEQAAGKQGDTGAQSDVYSLGAILYHLLTGRPPFQGETIQEILLQVQSATPVSPQRLNPGVPADLQTICLKCLRKDSSRRYDSARELADDLGHFLAGEPIRARAVSPVEKVWLWCKRRPVLTALIFALHVILVLGIAGVLWQWRRAEQSAHGERQQRLVAEEYAARVRLNLYAGDVNFAARALDRSDLGLARRTLAALKPQPGEEDLRGFEWRYLWGRCKGDQLATLEGHEGTVTCTAFSPDGKLLATGSRDKTVNVWNVARRERVTTLATATGAVWSVDFTPDARVLVSSGTGGTQLWDCNTWQVITNFPGQTASLARNSPLLATAEVAVFNWWQPPGVVRVWNYTTGAKVLELPRPARIMALAPDGKTLATARLRADVDLWDVASGELRQTLETTNAARSLVFSHDGRHLLAILRGNPILVFDLNSPKTPRVLSGHSMGVWGADFSPDAATIATTSSDQTLRLWDAATLELKQQLLGHEHEVWSVVFSPDGTTLATGGKDRKVMLWGHAATNPVGNLPNFDRLKPFFSPDGSRIVTVGNPYSRASSAVWNVRDGTLVNAVRGRRSIGFSPDGKQLIRWERNFRSLEFVPLDSTNVTRVALGGFDEKSKVLQYQGFSLDGTMMFVVDESGQAGVWEVTTGKKLAWVTGPLPPVSTGAISPDGNFLALTAEQESVIHFYNLANGKQSRLNGHLETVRGLSFSPDGTKLASGSLDGSIRLWDTTTLETIATLPGHMEETSDVAFSPDGRTLASVNLRHTIKLWHVATRREVVSWNFPQAGESVRFSPDGRYLAVTTVTNSIQLFAAPDSP